MKKFLRWPNRRPGVYTLTCFIMTIVCFTGCRKEPGFRVDFPPSLYTADVIDKWMTLEIRFYKDATGIFNGALARPFGQSRNFFIKDFLRFNNDDYLDAEIKPEPGFMRVIC